MANDIVARRVGARGDSGAELLAGLFERVGMERIEGAHEVVGIFYRVVALAASHVALALVVVDGLAAHLALVVKVDDGLRRERCPEEAEQDTKQGAAYNIIIWF